MRSMQHPSILPLTVVHMQKLLIDGHNLIGQTPGLSLADPNDEQKLIVMLRKYAARKQRAHRRRVRFGQSRREVEGTIGRERDRHLCRITHDCRSHLDGAHPRIEAVGRLDRGVLRSGSAASRAAAQDDGVELGRLCQKNGTGSAARRLGRTADGKRQRPDSIGSRRMAASVQAKEQSKWMSWTEITRKSTKRWPQRRCCCSA